MDGVAGLRTGIRAECRQRIIFVQNFACGVGNPAIAPFLTSGNATFGNEINTANPRPDDGNCLRDLLSPGGIPRRVGLKSLSSSLVSPRIPGTLQNRRRLSRSWLYWSRDPNGCLPCCIAGAMGRSGPATRSRALRWPWEPAARTWTVPGSSGLAQRGSWTRGSPRCQAISVRSSVSPSIASVLARRWRRGTAIDAG